MIIFFPFFVNVCRKRPGRPGQHHLRDRDQTEAHRRAGEQPAASAHAEAAVRTEADDAAEQDQRHTAGEGQGSAQHG